MNAPLVDPPAFLAPDVLADPYPAYRRLREQAPVGWCEPLRTWLVSGWEAADALLRDPRTRSNGFRRREAQVRAAAAAGDEVDRYDDLLRLVGLQMAFMDPPDHPRVRRALQAAFTPRTVEALRPRVASLVAEHLGALAPGDDLIAGLAEPLPAIVVAEVLGVPAADRDRFVAWSHALVEFVGTSRADDAFLDATQGALRDWAAFFAELAAAQPEGSVLGILLEQHRGGGVSWDELVANAIFLLAAGHETTTNLIGNGMLALARQPDAWRALRDDPSLVPTAVEELLRFDAPVQLLGRATSEPVALAGAELPAGADVVVVVGAANRDPAAFAEADRLVLDRTPNRHLAFAQGPHLCLGAALARLEGQEALRALRQRFAALDPPEEVEWRPNPAFRGLRSLPLG